MNKEIKEYLIWRRKTRFIRHHGGWLLACAIICTTIIVLWRGKMKRYEYPSESSGSPKSIIAPSSPATHPEPNPSLAKGASAVAVSS